MRTVASPFDLRHADPHRLVVAVLVAHQQIHGAAQAWLVAQDEAERAQRGQPAVLGEPEAEVIEPGGAGGQLEQPRDARGGNPLVGSGQVGRVEADRAHQRARVQPERLGQLSGSRSASRIGAKAAIRLPNVPQR